jgi:hypothetical protein
MSTLQFNNNKKSNLSEISKNNDIYSNNSLMSYSTTPTTLNTTLDILNTTNSSLIKTRYDIHSISEQVSIYGSRKPSTSIVSNIQDIKNDNKKKDTNFSKLKKSFQKFIFPNDDSYAIGEYTKDTPVYNSFNNSKQQQRSKLFKCINDEIDQKHVWNKKCDFFSSCLGYTIGL